MEWVLTSGRDAVFRKSRRRAYGRNELPLDRKTDVKRQFKSISCGLNGTAIKYGRESKFVIAVWLFSETVLSQLCCKDISKDGNSGICIVTSSRQVSVCTPYGLSKAEVHVSNRAGSFHSALSAYMSETTMYIDDKGPNMR